MPIKNLVIDQNALSILDSALIEDSWFDQFQLPGENSGLKRVIIKENIYLLSEQADIDSGLLIVSVGSTGIFTKLKSPRSAFERIIRVALRQFDHNISIPVQWQPFHQGSRLSVYANLYSRGEKSRIYFDRSPNGSGNIFAFGTTDQPESLDEIKCDIANYQSAVDNYLDALTTDQLTNKVGAGHYGIVLSQPLGLQLAGSGTLAEWYERILSAEQIRFVDQTNSGPIRLRGAAGTGKTQAMAVKCLRDLYADADAKSDKTFAFLTHSSSLAHEVVRGMFYALDPTERWANLKTASGHPKLWIGTLYELAQEQLGYEKKGLEPLSLDGREGRELQRLLILDAINYVKSEPRVALTLLKDCKDITDKLESEDGTKTLIEEIMNEFACVLDAENIRKGTSEADRYIRAPRESWQMSLPTEAHRKLLIEIHDAYRSALHKQRLLSMDQMIADFGRYLSTHEWSQLRERNGFDLIFIDEYHYFTRIEAMTLQSLFNSRAEHSGRWPLIMAYDLKQSTNDAALGGGLERFRNPGVGESTPVDLNKVYRSTPEIVSFLCDIDGSFPAIDLEGEFQMYNTSSANASGDTPILLEYESNTKLVDNVFDRAVRIRSNGRNDKKQVAVLCLNEELFDTYRNAGRIQDKMVAITSREDLRELRYAGNRCVFSMPEYVAGLQFDTVFLIHADDTDLQVEYLSQGARRRYVSRVYLGASRASNRLYLASSKERGGVSSILATPLKNKSVVRE